MQSDFFYTVWDAAEHSKDNPSTWGSLGRGSTLLRANPAPKWHTQVLPNEPVEPSSHCLKGDPVPGSCVLASYSSHHCPLLKTLTAPFAKHCHEHIKTKGFTS